MNKKHSSAYKILLGLFGSSIGLLILLIFISFLFNSRSFRCGSYAIQDFGSFEEFSLVWHRSDVEKCCLLKWLLNEEPIRHGKFENSKLIGLNRDEVLRYLGGNLNVDDTGYSWPVGDIEGNSIFESISFIFFPAKKLDWLHVEWNENGVIVNVTTRS